MEEKISFTGIIKRVKFHNPLNGYGILSVEIVENDDFKDNVVVTVNQPKVFEGVTMSFTGTWIKHPTYGNQFKADSCYEMPPATKEAVIRYLSSGFFKGIGAVTARKIVNHFGDSALDVFRNNIERLIEVPKMDKKKLTILRDSWKENQEMNNIMLFLQEHMISTIFSVKIYKQYGIDSIPIIKKNPYRLSADIYGVGFVMADKLALSLGFGEKSEERITAAIHHILSNNQSDGHCYLTERQIKGRVKDLIKVEVSEIVKVILDKQELEEKIVCINFSKENNREEKRYYSRDIYYDEKYVAEKAVRLAKKKYVSDKSHLEEKLNLMLDGSEIKLSDEQFDSVIGCVSNGLSILTGGPGVGKTTTVKYIYDILVLMGKNVLLAAPTGRAAQRMSEVIGTEAKTIHRLLKWDAVNTEFRMSEKDNLDCDAIILDEASMLDIKLASSFFRAISPNTQVILVGDKNQLPSVSCGNVLSDLIESESVNVYSLEKVFRQAASSKIITYAHNINKGTTPEIATPLKNPEMWKNGSDCMFIDSSMDKNNVLNYSTTQYGMDALDMIVKLYKEIIPKYFGKENEIQILTPMNKGSIGTKEINKRVQDAINPKDNKKNEILYGDKIFREGDRVIQTQNNYDLNVFNGDIGYITRINPGDMSFIVKFGNEKNSKIIIYEKSNLPEIELAYSITIHKSQGSEFSTIIMPILNQHYIMLYRNLIYTGLTRARKLCIMIGEKTAFDRSIKNIDPNIRQTSLVHFLKENYNEVEHQLEFLD
jgi:exodeoxyribonuclease V alpha subunit